MSVPLSLSTLFLFVGEESIARFDELRYASGSTPTAAIRLHMQKVMQKDAAVFRTQETLANGVVDIDETAKMIDDIKATPFLLNSAHPNY